MKILVLGSSGQLGQALQARPRRAGDVYLFASRTELDILNTEAIERLVTEEGVEVIVNCAAYTAVDRAEDEPELCDEINHRAVATLADLCARRGIYLVHISTDYVFSGRAYQPLQEGDIADPLGVYGRSKRRGEEAILASGASAIIVRTSWLYSEYGANFVKTILRLLGERDMLRVVADQIGSPTYAGDLACFLIYIIESGQIAKAGIYHFSNEGVASWYDLAHGVATLVGSSAEIAPCRTADYPTRAKRPAYSLLSKEKAKATFGIRPRHWREALGECIERLEASETNIK